MTWKEKHIAKTATEAYTVNTTTATLTLKTMADTLKVIPNAIARLWAARGQRSTRWKEKTLILWIEFVDGTKREINIDDYWQGEQYLKYTILYGPDKGEYVVPFCQIKTYKIIR